MISKTLIISDIHSAPLTYALELAREEKVDRILCLGDFDHPERARELRNCGIDFMLAIGNHDCWFITLISPSFYTQHLFL
ncbi:metallophosphoesterase [Candidatus Pacearchaeota archaeon]|nr:metallophosphoesterase [Candidatus Pacearchaeota archaeon]